MGSMTEATEKFLTKATWLGDEDAPAVALLRATALQLDQDYTSSKASVYGATHRQLLKKRPAQVGPKSEGEQFLEEMGL